jgi:hypothetical protein
MRDGLRALSVEWAELEVSSEALAKLSYSELDALGDRVAPFGALFGFLRDDPSVAKACAVGSAVYWEQKRRGVEKLVTSMGVAVVSTDDLDKLDDLSPDVF